MRCRVQQTAAAWWRTSPPPKSDAWETAAPRAATPPTAAQIGARWDEVLQQAQAHDGRLAEALRRARPGAVEDDRLLLHVPSTDALARTTLERRETVRLFRQTLSETFGVPLGCRLVVEAPAACGDAPAAAGSASAQPERTGEGIAEHPSIRLVREATDGRLLNVEKEPPSVGRDT